MSDRKFVEMVERKIYANEPLTEEESIRYMGLKPIAKIPYELGAFFTAIGVGSAIAYIVFYIIL